MNAMLKVYLNVVNYFASEEGQGMAEYGLIIALVAVLLIGALTAFKEDIAGVFTNIGAGFDGTAP